MEEYFGIDFGTTNSAVVGRLRKNITYYHDGYGQPFPSLVAIDKANGEIHAIGREAWNHRAELSEYCQIITSAKMELGTDRTWRIGPELWTPESVVTEFLKGLMEIVTERTEGGILNNPVIAIPVGFSHQKRSSLRIAAKAAGMSIRGFISEPTAAVISNYDQVNKWPIVVVFDWGGGTLDISVVKIRKDEVREIATVAIGLGGDNLDLILAEWAHKQILKDKNYGDIPFLSMDSTDRDHLISKCEEAKRNIGTDEDKSWEITILRYGEFGTINLVITEDKFISLMRPKINEAMATLEECVTNRAKLSFEEIGCIIMVGGSSSLMGLHEALNSRGWSSDPYFPPKSEWHGSAMLASDFGDYVCAQNIGLRLCDGTFYPLLEAGKTINSSSELITFGLLEDSDNARFVFVESDSEINVQLTPMDRIIGYLSVPTYGFSNEPVHLESYVDENMLFHVSAKSECRGELHRAKWTYTELKFSYRVTTK